MRPFPEPTSEVSKTLLEHLTRQSVAAGSLRSAADQSRSDGYLRWVEETERVLTPHFARAELEAALRTNAYWAALEAVGVERRHQVATLIDAEAAAMADTLQATHDQLAALRDAWAFVGTFVVPDTNLYVHHPEVDFRNIDWHAAAGVGNGVDITLLVPMIVVDELDRIKDRRAGQESSNPAKAALAPNRRAAATLKTFRDLFASGHRPGNPICEPLPRHGTVHIELVADALRHHRLDDADSELIDRCLRVAALSGRPVRFVTNDNGAYFRARAAGLVATHIDWS